MYSRIRKIHFVGIGGIGMSGIAEVLLNLGYEVCGSDLSRNASVLRLESLGARIFQGHHEDHVSDAHVVVHSAAVRRDNPELVQARRKRIPVVPRAEMLAELMRFKYGIAVAGTHGKTTTTSLIATLLATAGMDPTVVNGGIVKAFASNARLGQGQFLVTEADESDGSFVKLNPTIAVVTNMDPEHMEHYGEFQAMRDAYDQFVAKIPFYGLAVLCHDHPESAALNGRLDGRRVVTYGLEPGADYRAVDLQQEGHKTTFRVVCRTTPGELGQELGMLTLSLLGRHNVANALAAVAVGLELGLPWETMARAFDDFQGVQRRFDVLLDTPRRMVVDDYAHHPVEIRATLSAARAGLGRQRRLVAVFQPHRYSRVEALKDGFLQAFRDADLVMVMPIYAAGEKPSPTLADGGQEMLMEGIQRLCNVPTLGLAREEGWMERLAGQLQDGDAVIFLGAGDVTQMARQMAERWREGEAS